MKRNGSLRVLLVEDHAQYAELIGEKLHTTFGYEVTLAHDPLAAVKMLRSQDFDVAVVDVLYRRLSEAYNKTRERARISLADLEPYNVSGLVVLYEIAKMSHAPRVAIWTSGDPNRALHIVLAHQAYGVRAFCSKESHYDDIGRAIRAADSQSEHVDITLRPFLPRRRLSPIGRILFAEAKWRAIWRALASGSQSHDAIAQMTNYSEQTIRKAMSPMAHALSELHPQLSTNRQLLNALSSYATFHWEFFLDRAVKQMFPHA